MEILALLAVAGILGYVIFGRKKAETIEQEAAPYKIETPTVVVENTAPQVKSFGDTTSGGGPAIEGVAYSNNTKKKAQPKNKANTKAKAKPTVAKTTTKATDKSTAKPKTPKKPKTLKVAK